MGAALSGQRLCTQEAEQGWGQHSAGNAYDATAHWLHDQGLAAGATGRCIGVVVEVAIGYMSSDLLLSLLRCSTRGIRHRHKKGTALLGCAVPGQSSAQGAH